MKLLINVALLMTDSSSVITLLCRAGGCQWRCPSKTLPTFNLIAFWPILLTLQFSAFNRSLTDMVQRTFSVVNGMNNVSKDYTFLKEQK